MKIKISLILSILIVIFAFTSCTVNVNSPNANTNNVNTLPARNSATPFDASSNQKHWSVVVCSSRAKTVTLSAGTSATDGEVFATWQEGTAQRKFDLPVRVQNSSRVYLKGSASDKNQVEMCILYDGRAKKRVEFDDDEDVIVNSSDVDDLNKCRCAE